ncbi:major facilitator superfamily MFS_1, partial [mine drainage metagenome]
MLAGFLGWALDAFDFFLLIFVLKDVATTFHASMTEVTLAIFLTLATRPVGALFFGVLSDRYGRRPVLMAVVMAYSVFGFLSALAPSLALFFLLRAFFGIAMGGEWGAGSSLVMESVPPPARGFVSGILQAGYPSGYLLASLAYAFVYPITGWRGL